MLELKRRSFAKWVTAAAAASLAGAWTWMKQRPPRWMAAVPWRKYPGRVRPLDGESVQKPGKWVG